MKAQAVNKLTGEVVEYEADNLGQIVEAWRSLSEKEKVIKEVKEQLKSLIPLQVNTKGLSEPVGGYMFRVSNVQRKNYDKSVLREVLDEDTLDLLLKPDKPKVDDYIKENLEVLGEHSTRIRQSMVDEGKPYQVIKLERLDRK